MGARVEMNKMDAIAVTANVRPNENETKSSVNRTFQNK